MIHFILDPTKAPVIESLAGVAEAIFALALIIVGIAQVYVYFMQAKIMAGQLVAAKIAADASKDASDSLRITERAFLGVEKIELKIGIMHGGPRSGNFSGITLGIRNFGKTPANLREIRLFFRALDHEPCPEDELRPSSITVEDQPTPMIVIGADRVWQSPMISCWDQHDGSDPRQGQNNIFYFVWGRITYRTVFAKDATTTFKLKYHPRFDWIPIGKPEDNQGE